MTGILRAPRAIALAVIASLVIAASLVSFAESYRGLFLWAHGHGLAGAWAAAWPLQVDVFIAVGELALFVALADYWAPRSRAAAWAVTLAGLAVSVAGNVGHVASHSLSARVTAAIPPLAAASALAVGLGVLKRVVEGHERAGAGAISHPLVPAPAPVPVVPSDAEHAATIALRATLAAGNPYTVNALAGKFSLPRKQAAELRTRVLAEANGHREGGGPA